MLTAWVAAVWAAAWVWPSPAAAQRGVEATCPSWEDNPQCICYTRGGVVLECPSVPLAAVGQEVGNVPGPISFLSLYNIDPNVTTLPPGLFTRSSGVASLQVSHSAVRGLAEDSLEGLETSLDHLTVSHCQLSAVPHAALLRLRQLHHLSLEANNITELQSFVFSKLKLHTLNLKGNMISLISDYALDGLESSLQELNLENNDLKALPTDALKSMAALRTLRAAWNHVKELDLPACSLAALQELDLSSNSVRKIKSKSVAGAPGLASLSLYMNAIASVSKNAFKENPALETLFLGNNDIQELDAETFLHNPNIRIIDLSNNNLHNIDGGLFSDLPHLQELVLASNNIREVTRHTFRNSSSLQVLNLEHNAIRFVEEDSLWELPQLHTLLLSHNNLQEVSPRLLKANTALQVLKLDHNRLGKLHEDTFSNNTALTTLHLSHNELTTVGRTVFWRLTLLQELHLENNRIQVVAPAAFSSLAHLQTLTLQDNDITTLPEFLSTEDTALRQLRVSGNRLTSLHPQLLQGQGSLDQVWLDRNNISVVVEGVFGELRRARQLHLEHNHIVQIQDNVFSNMTHLRRLFLSHNFVETIGNDTFTGLASLLELRLDNNAITVIETDAFRGLTRLDTLDLSGNTVSVVQRDHFVTELPIRSLRLDGAGVAEIEEGALEALASLETLSLRDNELRALHPNFLQLTQLRHLDLAGNPLKDVNSTSLAGLPNLESLDLSRCGLAELPDNLFDSSMSLRSLSLAGNKLTHLKAAAFVGLSDLTQLDLSDNSLGLSSCRAVLVTPRLQQLTLSGNPTRELCPALAKLEDLRELRAANVLMTEVRPDSLAELRHLQLLDISTNLLTEVPVGSFLGSSLRTLSLADNRLEQLPDALFFDLPGALQSLNISGNPLRRLVGPMVPQDASLSALQQLEATHTNLSVVTSLELSHLPGLRSLSLRNGLIAKVSPGAFKSLTQLAHLDLSHNQLKVLPPERLRGLGQLVRLNLTYNRLEKLDQLPADASNLKVLDASSNVLTELREGALRHAAALEEVDLSDNFITSIHTRAFTNLPRLAMLDLSHNMVEVLRPEVLQPVERSLRSLSLHGNSLQCTCEAVDLWAWLLNHPEQVTNPRDLTCELPQGLEGRAFLLLPSSAFCPQPVVMRLAIQDIQSQSLLVSWQATNSSAVYGFKVTYRAADGSTTQSSPSLSLGSRTFLLESLQPATEYEVCVHGLTRSLATPHAPTRPHARAHTIAAAYDKADHQDNGVRCGRGQTLPPPAAPATGPAGISLGLILGATLTAALLLGLVVALIWYRKCGPGNQARDKRNGAPPDYYTQYQARHPHPPPYRDDEFAC
ncbi:LOW QUALITY PROTEIN: protein artichoke-like [Portunus trituberculatus]|uniref:LOW QUALITY PROTEIN: protein artichoke-like n=1 Tax=Portunus trituberculatus TaxID=210409 RepID=UPI001E1CCB1F|nr:LOW QUALITY PROTEIN: protein artichoke-like [Portunus trituberculatus]